MSGTTRYSALLARSAWRTELIETLRMKTSRRSPGSREAKPLNPCNSPPITLSVAIALPKYLPLRRWFLPRLGILLFGPRLFALDPFQDGVPIQYPDLEPPEWAAVQSHQFDHSDCRRPFLDGHAERPGFAFRRRGFHPARPSRIVAGWRSMSVKCLTPSPRGGFWFGLDAGAFGYFDGTNQFSILLHADWILPQMYVSRRAGTS